MDPGGSPAQKTPAQKTTYSLIQLLVIGVVLLLAIVLRLYTLDTSPNYDSMATFTETQNTTPEALSAYATMYNFRHLSTVDKSTPDRAVLLAARRVGRPTFFFRLAIAQLIS